jgi:exosome complex RNA-binding protein Rrp42 (RNase PH superfamily)
LNYDGNVLDACLIAALAALTNGIQCCGLFCNNLIVRLPTVEVTDAGVLQVVPNAPMQALQILHYPIPLTFAMFDDFILTDPTSEEEDLQTGTFTIVFNNQGKLCSLTKPGLW